MVDEIVEVLTPSHGEKVDVIATTAAVPEDEPTNARDLTIYSFSYALNTCHLVSLNIYRYNYFL